LEEEVVRLRGEMAGAEARAAEAERGRLAASAKLGEADAAREKEAVRAREVDQIALISGP